MTTRQFEHTGKTYLIETNIRIVFDSVWLRLARNLDQLKISECPITMKIFQLEGSKESLVERLGRKIGFSKPLFSLHDTDYPADNFGSLSRRAYEEHFPWKPEEDSDPSFFSCGLSNMDIKQHITAPDIEGLTRKIHSKFREMYREEILSTRRYMSEYIKK